MAVRMIDPWVNASMGGRGQQPEWLIRVQQDYFRAGEEFLAEAQEIVETLSRDLLVLDQSQKEGTTDPDLVNEIFRGVHTLKGIAGMFGYHQIGAVAHALEDLLEDLRLGRVGIAYGVVLVIGRRTDGGPIAEYRMTRNMNNSPEGTPGSHTYVKDYAQGINAPKETPPRISVHRGHNGGPVIYRPKAFVIMDVS